MTLETKDAEVIKELLRLNLMMKNIAFRSGFNQKDWEHLHDKTKIQAEAEFLNMRARMGDL